MAFMIENHEIYQKSLNFADKMMDVTEALPSKHHHIIDQLNRASLSVSLNLAEGNGRWHKKERKEFFWIARGSIQECVPILELCRRKNFISTELHTSFLNELEAMANMIAGLIKGIDE